jgi:hypothetical protein
VIKLEAWQSKKGYDDFLWRIPIKKHQTWEVRDDAVCLIFKHDKMSEKFMRWFVKEQCMSDIELDVIGSSVWRYIDGESSVYEIAEIIIEEFGEGCQPVYDRLIMYLRYLNRKGWIDL